MKIWIVYGNDYNADKYIVSVYASEDGAKACADRARRDTAEQYGRPEEFWTEGPFEVFP